MTQRLLVLINQTYFKGRTRQFFNVKFSAHLGHFPYPFKCAFVYLHYALTRALEEKTKRKKKEKKNPQNQMQFPPGASKVTPRKKHSFLNCLRVRMIHYSLLDYVNCQYVTLMYNPLSQKLILLFFDF